MEIKPGFSPGYAIQENPVPELMKLYAQEMHGAFRREGEAHTDWWRCHPGPVHWQHERAVLDDFYHGAMYHDFWRPQGIHHGLEGLVSEPGRPLGVFILYRAKGERQFNAREAAELHSLLPHLAHGLTTRPDQEDSYIDSGRSGQVILDGAGRITHQSDTAQQLLYLLTHPQGSDPRSGAPSSPAALFKKLIDDLSAIARGREAPPPVLHRRNPWGRYVLRAYRLDATSDRSPGLTLVTLKHQEPLPLRLLRGLKTLPLSVKEREVCFALAQGQSLADAARRLQIQPGTAKKYADAAYVKLGVHQRTELSQRILAEAGPRQDREIEGFA